MMRTEGAYIQGTYRTQPGPLGRFIPQVPEGVTSTWLKENAPSGSWVLDPFGASAQVSIEAARAGYRVFVTSNNPIDRFIIEWAANPPTEAELRANLADLGALQKGDTRIEPHIKRLYTTICDHCKTEVVAEAFIWERSGTTPSQRVYTCPSCGNSGEFPITPGDEARLTQLPASALYRSRALERVAGIDDPDRAAVAEALDVYLPRSLYALFTLINKVDSTTGHHRRIITGLLLAALDQCTTLWHHPPQKTRPRTLSTPPRFKEVNVWLALEDAVNAWARVYQSNEPTIPVTIWPAQPPASGGICLYTGRIKDLGMEWQKHPTIDGHEPPIKFNAVVLAMPRPNQAYWTLSTLWSGWLWGREAAAPFKSALRRRRYDWNWHATALTAALGNLPTLIGPDVPGITLVEEVEPGFLTATVIASALTDLSINSFSMRQAEEQAQLTWKLQASPSITGTEPQPINLQNRLVELFRDAGQEFLRQRGEPASYLLLHSAALGKIAREKIISTEHIFLDGQNAEPTPAELLTQIHNGMQQAFSYRNGFIRYHGSQNSLEVGQWWLREDGGSSGSEGKEIFNAQTAETVQTRAIEISLSDRIEIEIVRELIRQKTCLQDELETLLLNTFTGLDTPDSELIQACLASYVEESPPNSGLLRLRDQEAPSRRKKDLENVTHSLIELGKRLSYSVEAPVDPNRWVTWRDGNKVAYAFYPLASAVISKVLSQPEYPEAFSWLVYPGGRAALLQLKLKRDARLQGFIDHGWRFLKFRHLRRLIEREHLGRENLDDQLMLDPITNQDQQIAFM